LLGGNLSGALFKIFGLPNIIVFDSHLHDFITSDKSYEMLPAKMKFAWGRNRELGFDCFKRFVELLKEHDYQFITMTELFRYASKGLLQ